MNNMNNWIEHLQHPLVLAGFGLFIIALLLRPLFLNNKKISGAGMERLLRRGINFVFILALLAIIGGIVLNWQQNSTGSEQSKVPSEAVQQSAVPQKLAPSPPKEPTVENKQGVTLSISASGQGQVSVGGDVINAKGNVEKSDGE